MAVVEAVGVLLLQLKYDPFGKPGGGAPNRSKSGNETSRALENACVRPCLILGFRTLFGGGTKARLVVDAPQCDFCTNNIDSAQLQK